jgi:hypothetical protein
MLVFLVLLQITLALKPAVQNMDLVLHFQDVSSLLPLSMLDFSELILLVEVHVLKIKHLPLHGVQLLFALLSLSLELFFQRKQSVL